MSRRWGPPHPDRRDWPSYNEQLVVRGEFFLDPTPFEHWAEELATMNRSKRGGRKRGGQYRLPESFVRWLVIWKQFLDYRSLEGLIRRLAALGLVPSDTSADYTTLWHRLHHLTPAVKLPKFTDLELATDGSGLKTGNAGEYRIFRYGDPEAKRRKHLVVVITADVRREKLLGIEVHLEGVGHSEAGVAERHLRAATAQGQRVRTFYGDGAFDTQAMFRTRQEMAVEPVIKIARNAATWRRHSPGPGAGRVGRRCGSIESSGIGSGRARRDTGCGGPGRRGSSRR